MRALQISKTPLVAAPSRIAGSLVKYTDWDSLHFYEQDYPGDLKKSFVADAVSVDLKNKHSLEVFADYAIGADIIHVHNMISKDLAEWLKKNVSSAKFIYHVHSPVREGPLYLDKWREIALDFDSFFVVAQFHPRMYPQFVPMPNIVPWEPVASISGSDELSILYSPSHRRSGRWNTKVSSELDRALELSKRKEHVKVISLDKPILPKDLYMLRKHSSITIDEISTGGFHMVSLEGLMCGNVVINGADEFSIASFRGSTESQERPPFVFATPKTIEQDLMSLIDDRELLTKTQMASSNYASTVLRADKLIRRYVRAYEEIA